MRDVCFIADVAVLPRWIRVSQALDYLAGVHPRFDRAKAEGFLAKTSIRRTSKVRELSKGMVTQLHLALVMAIDAGCWCWTSRRSASTSSSASSSTTLCSSDYFDRSRTIAARDPPGGGGAARAHRPALHRSRPHRLRPQRWRSVEARYREVLVRPEQLAAARALQPMHEREALGRSVMLFDGRRPRTARRRSARCARRAIADLFVAVMGGPRRRHEKEPRDEHRLPRTTASVPRPQSRRGGCSTGRCGASCGRTARSTWRRWPSPRSSLVGFADRPVRSAGEAPRRAADAGGMQQRELLEQPYTSPRCC